MSTQNTSSTPLSAPSALMPCQAVPALSVPALDHGLFTLGEDAASNFTPVDFYRGLHCPICLKDLLELGRLQAEFDKRGVKVIAISSDARDRVQTMPFARPHFDKLLVALDFALDKNDPARGEYAGPVRARGAAG